MIKVGIIQGRLSNSDYQLLQAFPENNWENEFLSASEMGFNYIELIDQPTKPFNYNPIHTFFNKDNTLLQLIKKTHINIDAICLDYFLNNSIYDDQTLNYFNHIVEVCKCLKTAKIVIPLLGKNDINYLMEKELIKVINKLSIREIPICIEMNCSGELATSILTKINYNSVSFCFDTGNLYLNKNDLVKDVELLKDRIGHIHLKDKDKLGNSVDLGTGRINFDSFFLSLSKIKYSGTISLETPRGNNALASALRNLNFLLNMIKKYHLNCVSR